MVSLVTGKKNAARADIHGVQRVRGDADAEREKIRWLRRARVNAVAAHVLGRQSRRRRRRAPLSLDLDAVLTTVSSSSPATSLASSARERTAVSARQPRGAPRPRCERRAAPHHFIDPYQLQHLRP